MKFNILSQNKKSLKKQKFSNCLHRPNQIKNRVLKIKTQIERKLRKRLNQTLQMLFLASKEFVGSKKWILGVRGNFMKRIRTAPLLLSSSIQHILFTIGLLSYMLGFPNLRNVIDFLLFSMASAEMKQSTDQERAELMTAYKTTVSSNLHSIFVRNQ